MADEITDCNRISVWKDPDERGRWHARIGPSDGLGLNRWGESPIHALAKLLGTVATMGWIFDPSWIPKDIETS